MIRTYAQFFETSVFDNPHDHFGYDKFLSDEIYTLKYLFRNIDHIFLDIFEDMGFDKGSHLRDISLHRGLYNINHDFCFGTDATGNLGLSERIIDFSKDTQLSSWSFSGPYTKISDISLDKKEARDYDGETMKCMVFWIQFNRNRIDEYCKDIKSTPVQLLHKYESRVKRCLSGRPDINVKSLLYKNMNGYMFTYCIY